MEFQEIEVYKDGVLGVIKLVSEEPSKALTGAILNELQQILGIWNDHPGVEVIVLTVDIEHIFSLGTAQSEIDQEDEFLTFQEQLLQLCLFIEGIDKLVIAMLNGIIKGSVFELAMACDFRIASSTSFFSIVEGTYSLPAGAGGIQRISRLIGRSKTLEFILSNEAITVNQAYTSGLINIMVDSKDLWETLYEFTRKMIHQDLEIRTALKKLIKDGEEVPLAQAITLESLVQQKLYTTNSKKRNTDTLV